MDDGNVDTCNGNDKKAWFSNLHISRCHRLWVHRRRRCHSGHISRHPCSSCHHLGAECVIHFLLIWILKQMFSFFPFSFKLDFPISFSSLLFFRYPNIATSIIYPLGPALHLDSKQMRIFCNASVRLVWLWPICPFWGDLYSFFHQFPSCGRRRRSNLSDKTGLEGNPCLMGAVCPNVRLTSSHYLQGRFAIQSFFRTRGNPFNFTAKPL